MTNTRITDAEVYELRYPVFLRQFSIRQGSGGVGCSDGGDRAIGGLECMPLSGLMLSKRRVYRLYG
jgi:5-oxoprolinase (ATP-hydrolysing)